MQGLYPIIRRQRRPLLVADAPPVVAGNVEPANGEPIRAKNATEARVAQNTTALSVAKEEAD